MAQVKICDITSKVGVPMLQVLGNAQDSQPEISTCCVGEKLNYGIIIENMNGYDAKDVSEEYVVEELCGLLMKRLNELRNPPKERTDSTDIKKL